MNQTTCCPEKEIKSEPIEFVETKESEQDFLLNKELRSDKRMQICLACPDLMALNMCRYCKCFMNIKTRIYKASCPLGKW